VEDFAEALILPGLVNTHTHLELTALRGYLENEENDFFAWLRKLTLARLEKLTPDDLRVSATWGACEAVRAGITCVGDASDSAMTSMLALTDVGLRGVVFQESFGPDPRLVNENFEKLEAKVAEHLPDSPREKARRELYWTIKRKIPTPGMNTTRTRKGRATLGLSQKQKVNLNRPS
jgi:5-methylthioadenosine/S-adenosylhomocysteine deaminase